jgi:hemerythrin-like domain-containing protein
LAAITHGAVFDITGGILTTVGLLFAGFATNFKRRKIISGFQEEIAKGRQNIDSSVTEQLKTYIKRLKERIDSNFDPFDLMLEKEKEQIAQLTVEHGKVEGRFQDLEKKLEQLMLSSS